MRKEIKVSDLFKRKPKADEEPKAEKPAKEPKPKKEKRRKEKPPKADKGQKTGATFAHEAPPPAEIPLMRAFNLLPKEEARLEKERSNPLPAVLVALAGVLVFAALAAFYLMAGADVTKKQGQVEDLRAELAPYEAAKNQPSVKDKSAALATERLARTSALGSALTGRLAWDRVLRELALVIPDDVSLDSIQATAPATSVVAAPTDGSTVQNFTLTGTTKSQSSVAELLARLAVIPELDSVQLETAEQQAPGSDLASAGSRQVKFTVSGSLRAGA
jgi:Tfp pilus assembly protein PilN